MKADGVSDYRQLASFGDTVLAATYSEKSGFMFCTWKQNADGDSVFWGDYSPNYEYVYRSMLKGTDYGMTGAAGMLQSVLCFGMIMAVNAIVKKINAESALF